METQQLEQHIAAQAAAARTASYALRKVTTKEKNEALLAIAASIKKQTLAILEANKKDLEHLGEVSTAFRNRLVLTEEKIAAIAAGVEAVAALADPVGNIVEGRFLPNGLKLEKVRIPIGVIACIFESRPNVVVDIAALAIKSGNASVLRGGKEALHTNTCLAACIHDALSETAIPVDTVQFIAHIDRAAVPVMASQGKYIDLIIPRGGEGLVDAVCTHARMPVLQHRKGITHVFVDDAADLKKATAIVENGKISNPSACNSLEHVLVHQDVAASFIPDMVDRLQQQGVEVRGCEQTAALASGVVAATAEDFAGEYLDLILTIKVVKDYDAAIAEIHAHSTGLADAIVTESVSRARAFTKDVDSAATYVNASTRFTDGSEFGFGAEVGISTAKIHGMGPMGLEDLTVTKYIVQGDGHVRV